MARIEKVPSIAWLITGVVVGALVVAAAAYAGARSAHPSATSSGSTAGVTAAGQLETTVKGASSAYVATVKGVTANAYIAIPPPGDALIVTSIHVDSVNTPPASEEPSCQFVGAQNQLLGSVDPSSNGVTVLPFDPGVPIPMGKDAIAQCTNHITAIITIVGYSVPASAVPADAPQT